MNSSSRLPPLWLLPIACSSLLIALAFAPGVSEVAGLHDAFLWTAALLFGWQSMLVVWGIRPRGHVVVLSPTHYVQAPLQLCVFVYWGLYWRPVFDHAEQILAQIIFAYAIEMLLAWSRRRTWVIGFGPLPIVLSTNLFLWFRDDWFFFQFALIALGYFAKEFITWERDGKRTHIFNPSAFTLSVFSLGLIATQTTALTWGPEIAVTQSLPPHMYLLIFLLGLVVQYLFQVTLVTLAAAATLLIASVGYFHTTGVYFFGDSTIPVAVFLGLHLLITDPVTSPRTDAGRAVFGGLYGICAFVLFALLDQLGAPTFYDKLLVVPLLNLSVRVLDRFAAREVPLSARIRNLAYMGIWCGLFTLMMLTGQVGGRHPGETVSFWEQACVDKRRNACRNLVMMEESRCRRGDGDACLYLGDVLQEGRILPRDPERAALNYRLACERGVTDACAPVEEPKSGDGPATLLSRACTAGHGYSCAVLAKMYLTGTGVTQDREAAKRLQATACELGQEDACE